MVIILSGIDYFKLILEDIVIIDVEIGKIVDSNRVFFSESDMYRIFYKYRKGVFLVVYIYLKYVIVIFCIDIEGLFVINYLLVVVGIDVFCVEYVIYGIIKLVKNVFKVMEDKKVVFFSNYGMIVIGKNLVEVYNIVENVEFCLEFFCILKLIGFFKILLKEEMLNMIERFKDYGKRIEEYEEI